MKIRVFGRVLEIRNEAGTRPQDEDAWRAYFTGAGYPLSPLSALKVSAVFRCVDLVSKTVAALPLHLYEETATGKEKAKAHPAYRLTHVLPNPQTTAYAFWQMFVANLLLTRGAYAKVQRDARGSVRALWNIPTGNASEIQHNAVNGERYIDVTLTDGRTERLREGEFLYVPSFLFSSAKDPEDPIRIAADVLGLTDNLTRYARATFEQGVNPGGFIESPAGLSDKAFTRLKEDFAKSYAGVMNAGKFIILEEGTKANIFTRDMEKTQNLESRKFAVTEICRIFGVPAHLCMDMEHATFSNIEQQSLEFVRDCIGPLCVRIEQALFKDVLNERDRADMFFKFSLNGLLRGDTAARTQYYNMMRQGGVMSANEIRRLEDMNDLPGADGDAVLINGNMIALENARINLPKGAKKGGTA